MKCIASWVLSAMATVLCALGFRNDDGVASDVVGMVVLVDDPDPACECEAVLGSLTQQATHLCPDGTPGVSLVFPTPTGRNGECSADCSQPWKSCRINLVVQTKYFNCMSGGWVQTPGYNNGVRFFDGNNTCDISKDVPCDPSSDSSPESTTLAVFASASGGGALVHVTQFLACKKCKSVGVGD